MSEQKLSGKVAIVTGASRGIGRAIAMRLAQDGANVIITYVQNQAKADEVVKAIKLAAPDSQALAVRCDLTQESDLKNLFDEVQNHFGRLDILVNNAATTNVFKPNADMTRAEYDSMFDITRGVYFALQLASRYIEDGGRIISLSTGGTSQSMAGAGAYAGSKAAIEQFSNALAKELGSRSITVNTLAPGVTDTDGMVLGEEQLAGLVAQTPLGRLGQPEDIAAAVALLASEDAHWITGQNIRATGGII